jgi:hypothetical protein
MTRTRGENKKNKIKEWGVKKTNKKKGKNKASDLLPS